MINRYDALICCSSEDASLLGRSDVTIVPNAVDLSAVAYEPSPAVPRILFIGPSRSPQNVPGITDFLDQVYSLLLREFHDLELWIVGGKGALEWARDFPSFRQRGVRLFEYVESVQPLLRQCALTINPIRGNRGSCRKVVESIAAGRVCVSTREGARGYLESGFPSLVTCEEVQEFAAPLRRLLHDVAYRRSLEKLDERHLHALSWECFQQRILDLYSTLERKLEKSDWENR
jgi:glycosyltransferase involved in cell wall biosynthesis